VTYSQEVQVSPFNRNNPVLWYNTVQLIDSGLAELHLNNLKSPQVMDIIVYVECSCMFREWDTAFCYLVGDVPELPFTLVNL